MDAESAVRIELARDAIFVIIEELAVFVPWTLIPELWDSLSAAKSAALCGAERVDVTLTWTNANSLRRWIHAQRNHPDLLPERSHHLGAVEMALQQQLGLSVR